MRSSKGTLLLATASLLIAGNTSAIAGPQSLMDPYAGMQAPNPAAAKAARARKEKVHERDLDRDVSRDPAPRRDPVAARTAPPAAKTAASTSGGDGFLDGVGEIKDGIVH